MLLHGGRRQREGIGDLTVERNATTKNQKLTSTANTVNNPNRREAMMLHSARKTANKERVNGCGRRYHDDIRECRPYQGLSRFRYAHFLVRIGDSVNKNNKNERRYPALPQIDAQDHNSTRGERRDEVERESWWLKERGDFWQFILRGALH